MTVVNSFSIQRTASSVILMLATVLEEGTPCGPSTVLLPPAFNFASSTAVSKELVASSRRRVAVAKGAGGEWIPCDVYKSRTYFRKLAIGLVGDISFSAPAPVSVRYRESPSIQRPVG